MIDEIKMCLHTVLKPTWHLKNLFYKSPLLVCKKPIPSEWNMRHSCGSQGLDETPQGDKPAEAHQPPTEREHIPGAMTAVVFPNKPGDN